MRSTGNVVVVVTLVAVAAAVAVGVDVLAALVAVEVAKAVLLAVDAVVTKSVGCAGAISTMAVVEFAVDAGASVCASKVHPPTKPTKLPAAMNIRTLVIKGFFCFFMMCYSPSTTIIGKHGVQRSRRS